MSTAILFSCPQCHSVFEVKPEWIGRKAKCPQCGVVSRITGRVAPPPRDAVPPMENERSQETVHDIIPKAAPAWEYRVLRHDFAAGEDAAGALGQAMNTEGAAGWECISVLPPPVALVVYKRAKR